MRAVIDSNALVRTELQLSLISFARKLIKHDRTCTHAKVSPTNCHSSCLEKKIIKNSEGNHPWLWGGTGLLFTPQSAPLAIGCKSQLLTDYLCISAVPKVITNCPPHSSYANLHTTFSFIGPIHQSHLTCY